MKSIVTIRYRDALYYTRKQIKDFFLPIYVVVGIFWKDIVYFENGKIPNKPTQMYTEGQIFLQTPDVIILKNPETLTIEHDQTHNHPQVKPTFYTIPKVLITEIEFYDKQL